MKKIVSKVLLILGIFILAPLFLVAALIAIVYKTAKYGFDSFEIEDKINLKK